VVVKKGSVEKSQLFSEVERVKMKKSSFERVSVENWVEFWRWQSKVIEIKWKEMN
jgi:predicted nucleic acid-binding protein